MSDLETLQAELAELQATGAELDRADGTPGTDLVLSGSVEEIQTRMHDAQERARRHQVLVQAKVAEIKSYAEQQRRAMERAASEAERALEPIKKAMRAIGEQIKTIGLYLGTGERIVQLREGAAAPEGTPITVRQMVLRMDEEVAAAAEEGGLDWQDMAAFDKWLLADPEHLMQVLPEPKGVVCFTPRDPAKPKDEKPRMGPNPDAQMYWLIRNGERLWRTTTDFQVHGKLVPGPDTLTNLFNDRDGKPIRPGSHGWRDAQNRVTAAEQDYFRVQVILEGLLHRTPVFEPLPVQGMSFMDPAHHERGRLAFILDAEQSLGDGHEQFRAWQTRLNAQLRPGLRIVGAFNTGWREGFNAENYDSSSWRHGNARLHPSGASFPESGVIYELKHVQGKQLGFTYERTDKVYRGWREDSGDAKVRASCHVKSSDDWIIPFDLADIDDMRRFLRSRTDRSGYVAMFPVIKAAIKAKLAERESEEPFRVMLAGVLARENSVTVPEAEAAVPELVDWFKTTNKWHRPLIERERTTGQGGDGKAADVVQDMAAKAVRLITAEHARQVRASRRKPNMKLVTELRELYPSAIMVGRRRADGKYVVVVPQGSENVYAHVAIHGPRKGREDAQDWQAITKAQAARWEALWEHERWSEWNLDADLTKYLTDPELARLADEAVTVVQAREDDAKGKQVLGVTLQINYRESEFAVWTVVSEPVMPDPAKPLSSEGKSGKVVGFSVSWRRDADGRARISGRETYSTGIRHTHARWATYWMDRTDDHGLDGSPWPKDARVIWADMQAVAEQRSLVQQYSHLGGIRDGLSNRRHKLKQAVERAWWAAWWESQRLEFVREYGKPELWDGQRKVIEDRHERGFGKDKPEFPGKGLSELFTPFVESGDDEELWGWTVAEIVELAADPPELDASLLPLKVERDTLTVDDDVEWDDDEDGVEYDAEGSIEVAGELPETTGTDELVDAEVVEDGE